MKLHYYYWYKIIHNNNAISLFKKAFNSHIDNKYNETEKYYL